MTQTEDRRPWAALSRGDGWTFAWLPQRTTPAEVDRVVAGLAEVGMMPDSVEASWVTERGRWPVLSYRRTLTESEGGMVEKAVRLAGLHPANGEREVSGT